MWESLLKTRYIATCTFVGIRQGSFSIAREFAKEVSSHSLFLGCFPLISCEITSKNGRKICYVWSTLQKWKNLLTTKRTITREKRRKITWLYWVLSWQRKRSIDNLKRYVHKNSTIIWADSYSLWERRTEMSTSLQLSTSLNKCRYSMVYGMADSCLYNKQNDTWTFGDREFIFSCSHSISHSFDIDVNTRR